MNNNTKPPGQIYIISNDKKANPQKGGLRGRETLKAALPGIGYSFLVMALVFIFKLGLLWILAIAVAFQLGICIYHTVKGQAALDPKRLKALGKGLLISALFIGATFGYFALFGRYGLIAFWVFIVAIAGILIYRRRELYMQGIRQIETIIFGKALDKANWKPGEKPKAKRLRLWR